MSHDQAVGVGWHAFGACGGSFLAATRTGPESMFALANMLSGPVRSHFESLMIAAPKACHPTSLET